MAAREENLQSDLRSKRVKKTVYKGNKYTIKRPELIFLKVVLASNNEF